MIQQTTYQTTEVVETQPKQAYEQKKAIFRIYQIVWYVLGVIEVLLAARIILLMLAANRGSAFVNFIYGVSAPLAQPFRGIFGVTATGGNVFEWTSIVAMIVYAVVAYGLVQLFQLVKPTNPTEVEETV